MPGGGGEGVANLNFVTPPKKLYDNEISSIGHAICV